MLRFPVLLPPFKNLILRASSPQTTVRIHTCLWSLGVGEELLLKQNTKYAVGSDSYLLISGSFNNRMVWMVP